MRDGGDGRGPSRIGDVLEGVLGETGLREQIERQGVLEAWSGIVGEKIARVTRAVRVDDAVLFVEVDSSAWLMELDLMKPRILERVNAGRDEGRIEKIRFFLAESRFGGSGSRSGGSGSRSGGR